MCFVDFQTIYLPFSFTLVQIPCVLLTFRQFLLPFSLTLVQIPCVLFTFRQFICLFLLLSYKFLVFCLLSDNLFAFFFYSRTNSLCFVDFQTIYLPFSFTLVQIPCVLFTFRQFLLPFSFTLVQIPCVLLTFRQFLLPFSLTLVQIPCVLFTFRQFICLFLLLSYKFLVFCLLSDNLFAFFFYSRTNSLCFVDFQTIYLPFSFTLVQIPCVLLTFRQFLLPFSLTLVQIPCVLFTFRQFICLFLLLSYKFLVFCLLSDNLFAFFFYSRTNSLCFVDFQTIYLPFSFTLVQIPCVLFTFRQFLLPFSFTLVQIPCVLLTFRQFLLPFSLTLVQIPCVLFTFRQFICLFLLLSYKFLVFCLLSDNLFAFFFYSRTNSLCFVDFQTIYLPFSFTLVQIPCVLFTFRQFLLPFSLTLVQIPCVLFTFRQFLLPFSFTLIQIPCVLFTFKTIYLSFFSYSRTNSVFCLLSYNVFVIFFVAI